MTGALVGKEEEEEEAVDVDTYRYICDLGALNTLSMACGRLPL